jgi:phage terminase small subunit
MKKKTKNKRTLRWGLSTHKQVRFVEEYMIDHNALKAAIRAGYSFKTAYSIGNENLSKPGIKKAIEAGMKEKAESSGITVDRIVEEYKKLAFAKIDNFMHWRDGQMILKDSRDLPEGLSECISEVKQTIGPTGQVIVNLKLHDKKWALDALSKYLGLDLTKKQVELSGKDGKSIKISHKNKGLSEKTANELRRIILGVGVDKDST